MIKVTYTPAFQKAFQKFFKNQPKRQEIFLQKITLFMNDPFHPQLKTHKLKGSLKGFYAFSIEYDIRVILLFYPKQKFLSKTSAPMMKCTEQRTKRQ